MRLSGLATIAAVLPLISQAIAYPSIVKRGDCEFDSKDPDDSGIDFSSDTLCTTQDEGVYTFSMVTSMAAVPVPDPTQGSAGVGLARGFVLFDNNCNVKGVYPKPTCGKPYWLKSQWLPYDIKVTAVNFDVGDPYYRFAYGSGSYGNGENDCHCKNGQGEGEARVHCRCPFPYNGDGSRI